MPLALLIVRPLLPSLTLSFLLLIAIPTRIVWFVETQLWWVLDLHGLKGKIPF